MSPRNRQIPILLLVLICLAQCKSPSREIAEAFKTVDKSLDSTNNRINNSIDAIYLSIDSKRKINSTYALYADSIFYTTKNTYKWLDSLKDVLKSKDSTGENLYLATSIFIKTATGDTLLRRLTDVYKQSCSSLIEKSKKGSLDSVLVSIRQLQFDKNWKRAYFEMTSTVAALTILSKFQNDCINAAIITLQDIKDHMTL